MKNKNLELNQETKNTPSVKTVGLRSGLAYNGRTFKQFVNFIFQNFYNFLTFKVRTPSVQFKRFILIKPIAIWMFIIFPSIIQTSSMAFWCQTYQPQKSNFLVLDLQLNKFSNLGFLTSKSKDQRQHSNVEVCAGFFQNESLVNPNGGQVSDETAQNNTDQADDNFFHFFDSISIFMFLVYIPAMLFFLLLVELDIRYNFEYQIHRLLKIFKKTS